MGARGDGQGGGATPPPPLESPILSDTLLNLIYLKYAFILPFPGKNSKGTHGGQYKILN